MILAMLNELLDAFTLAAIAANEIETIVHEGPAMIYLIKPATCGCGNCIRTFTLSHGETAGVHRSYRMLMLSLNEPSNGWRSRIGEWIQPC